jgi:hypothetical protein
MHIFTRSKFFHYLNIRINLMHHYFGNRPRPTQKKVDRRLTLDEIKILPCSGYGPLEDNSLDSESIGTPTNIINPNGPQVTYFHPCFRSIIHAIYAHSL